MAPVTVFYHADCLDGFGAAYGAWRHFGDRATYRAVHHGDDWQLDDIVGHEVFVLDFSFSPQKLQAMAERAISVTQIDHHATALHACAGWLRVDHVGPVEFDHPSLPLRLYFDMNKSGVRLSWEWFNPDLPLPLSLAHIEDIDLWRFALPGTREFCRALRLLPFDFPTWHALVEQCRDGDTARYRELQLQGAAIEGFFKLEIERMASGRLLRTARLRGEPIDALQAVRHGQEVLSDEAGSWRAVRGLAINANALFASELGNLLAEKSGSFGMIWQLAGDGEAKVSLRSHGDFDVAAIAERYGGGGHRNAAGFRLPFARFAREILGQECDLHRPD